LFLSWHWSEVEEISFLWSITLLLFLLLWFLTFSFVLGSLFFSFFLSSSFDGFDLFGGLWSFSLCLQLGFSYWLILLWKNSGNLEHFSGTFTIRSSNKWGMNVQESS